MLCGGLVLCGLLFSAVWSCVWCCVVGLALIGALTWSQPDRDLKGGQSGNPFQIGSFFIYFQLGSRAPHTIFGFEKSDKIAQDPPIFGSAITIHVYERL